MAGYVISNYRINNPEAYQAYPPAVIPTILARGGEILVADYDSDIIEGQASSVTVVAKFSSKEVALAWYNSPEYQGIIHLRTNNAEGFLVITDEFVLPKN